MTIAEDFPWAKVGETAFIYQPRTFHGSLMEVTIIKVTTARVTVKWNDRGFETVFYCPKRYKELKELGHDLYHAPLLISKDDQRVSIVIAQNRRNATKNRTRKAAEAFVRNPSTELARAAIDELVNYIQEEEEG